MIPMQRFSFKQYGSEYCKDDKRHYFLDNLKLHQRKRTAIAYEPDAIGRNLKWILRQRYHPREQNNGIERLVGDNFHLLQLQMPVPGKRHEDIGYN